MSDPHIRSAMIPASASAGNPKPWFNAGNRYARGWNDGAGNPPNPDGIKTDYLWKRILTPSGLTNILERYTQVVEQRDKKTGKKRRV